MQVPKSTTSQWFIFFLAVHIVAKWSSFFHSTIDDFIMQNSPRSLHFSCNSYIMKHSRCHQNKLVLLRNEIYQYHLIYQLWTALVCWLSFNQICERLLGTNCTHLGEIIIEQIFSKRDRYTEIFSFDISIPSMPRCYQFLHDPSNLSNIWCRG